MKRAYLLLLTLCLLLLAACSGSDPADDPVLTNTAPPSTGTPVTAAPTPSPTPRAGGEVVITAAPGSTPSPVTIPSASAEPDSSDSSFAPVDLSGSFRSDTGTALNLYADWECVSVSAKNVRLTIVLSLESYSLSVGERSRNQLVVNGVPVTYHTDALEVPSGGLSKTELYTWTETMPLMEDGSLQLDLYASWEFSGSYSGVAMDTLEVSGHISIP